MIVVGAPVHERGWVLRRWFDGLAAQGEELTVVLNYGESTDDTLEIIKNENRFDVRVIQTDDVVHVKHRAWDLSRYETMARLRNDLLAVVRDLKPDFYLSCDTDMLLPRGALQTLVSSIGDFDGIAPLTYMTQQGTDAPNWLNEDLTRSIHTPEGVTEMYAVFGTVLMKPALYAVDYAAHSWGEDLGWAVNVRAAGLRLAMNADVRIKHVMIREALDEYDSRVEMT